MAHMAFLWSQNDIFGRIDSGLDPAAQRHVSTGRLIAVSLTVWTLNGFLVIAPVAVRHALDTSFCGRIIVALSSQSMRHLFETVLVELPPEIAPVTGMVHELLR